MSRFLGFTVYIQTDAIMNNTTLLHRW